MLDWIIKLSTTNRGVVLLVVVLIGGLGAWNFTRLPIDAVPDITNVQVVVNTAAPPRRLRYSGQSIARTEGALWSWATSCNDWRSKSSQVPPFRCRVVYSSCKWQ